MTTDSSPGHRVQHRKLEVWPDTKIKNCQSFSKSYRKSRRQQSRRRAEWRCSRTQEGWESSDWQKVASSYRKWAGGWPRWTCQRWCRTTWPRAKLVCQRPRNHHLGTAKRRKMPFIIKTYYSERTLKHVQVIDFFKKCYQIEYQNMSVNFLNVQNVDL